MRARLLGSLLALILVTIAAPGASPPRDPQAQPSTQLPRPQQLDRGIVWQRDPVTGELRAVTGSVAPAAAETGSPSGAHAIEVRTEMVPVTCIVATTDGTAVPGLRREDFRVFEDGVERPISYFDASTEPASVALVIDASPSVLRDTEEMKRAADALTGALAPLDKAAVVDFSAHTYLQLSFTDVRELTRRAVGRVSVRELLGDTGGSNVYEAVFLAARELFSGRSGRKAIVLLTDGQDSGLGLTLDPASAVPRPGEPENRLTFDDVVRTLAAEDVQVFAVSTENRPKIMTPEWLAAHSGATLVTPAVRKLGIPPYTLYLAELVRRAGGQLYFLREAETMADTFRKISQKIRAEYTIGFYPARNADEAAIRPGWHAFRVELVRQPGAHVTHRAAYYVSAAR